MTEEQVGAITIEEQPGARPGYEWFYSVFVRRTRFAAESICGTESTREAAEAEALRVQADVLDSARKEAFQRQ